MNPSLYNASRLLLNARSLEMRSANVKCWAGLGCGAGTMPSGMSDESTRLAKRRRLISAMDSCDWRLLLDALILLPFSCWPPLECSELCSVDGGAATESGVSALGGIMKLVPMFCKSLSNDDCIDAGNEMGLLAVTEPVIAPWELL